MTPPRAMTAILATSPGGPDVPHPATVPCPRGETTDPLREERSNLGKIVLMTARE
jgi:hypothetical protein